MSDTPLQSNYSSGKGDSSLTLYRGVGEITTTLAVTLEAAETELCRVVDATGAVQSGIAVCENEIFFFAERLNKDRVSVLTRGVSGTSAAQHLSGVSITLYPRFFIPQAWQDTILAMQNDVSVLAKTANYTLTSSDRNKVLTNEGSSGDVSFQLPHAISGVTFTFYVQIDNNLIIVANGGETIRIGTVVSSTAGSATSRTIGNYLILYAINTSEWIALSPIQNWSLT